jgi:hypothetical protein
MARYNQASGGLLVALTVAGFLVWATGTALWRLSVVLGITITLIGGRPAGVVPNERGGVRHGAASSV